MLRERTISARFARRAVFSLNLGGIYEINKEEEKKRKEKKKSTCYPYLSSLSCSNFSFFLPKVDTGKPFLPQLGAKLPSIFDIFSLGAHYQV